MYAKFDDPGCLLRKLMKSHSRKQAKKPHQLDHDFETKMEPKRVENQAKIEKSLSGNFTRGEGRCIGGI